MGKKEGELLKEERNYRSKSRVNWRPHGKQNFGLWTPDEQRLFVKGTYHLIKAMKSMESPGWK
jgi:hypothetical protein